MYGGTRTKGDLSHYRIQAAVERGDASPESVIKRCLVSFPSIWVSRDTVLSIAFAERKLPHSFMSVCACLFVSMY